MPATQSDPPVVARKRVRRALREFRDATPWSQGEVARKLGWSLSKVQRIESGDVGISVTDLRAMLDLYGINDADRIAELSADARISRRQRYLVDPAHREHLSPGLQQLMQYEQTAVSIMVYQPMFYPGALQTPAVADAMLRYWGGELSEDERRIRFQVRMSRRRTLIERPGGAEYRLVLDESVIRRKIEDIRTTVSQLDDLIENARRKHVHIRIVPFDRGAYMPALGAFQLLQLERGVDAVLYREGHLRDEIVQDPYQLGLYRRSFDELWQESLDEEATLTAIIAGAAAHRDTLARGAGG